MGVGGGVGGPAVALVLANRVLPIEAKKGVRKRALGGGGGCLYTFGPRPRRI